MEAKKQGKQMKFLRMTGQATGIADSPRLDITMAEMTISENRSYASQLLSWQLSIDFLLSGKIDSTIDRETDLIVLEQFKVKADLCTGWVMQFWGDLPKGYQIFIPEAELKRRTGDSLFYDLHPPSGWSKPYAVRKVS